MKNISELDQVNLYNLQVGHIIEVSNTVDGNDFKIEIVGLTDGGAKIKYNATTFWLPFTILNYIKYKSEQQ